MERIEPPDDNRPILDICCICGYEIRRGDDHFYIYGDSICDECGLEYLRRHKRQDSGDFE